MVFKNCAYYFTLRDEKKKIDTAQVVAVTKILFMKKNRYYT